MFNLFIGLQVFVHRFSFLGAPQPLFGLPAGFSSASWSSSSDESSFLSFSSRVVVLLGLAVLLLLGLVFVGLLLLGLRGVQRLLGVPGLLLAATGAIVEGSLATPTPSAGATVLVHPSGLPHIADQIMGPSGLIGAEPAL